MSGSIRKCAGASDTLNANNLGGTVNKWRWYKSPLLPALKDSISQKIIPADSGRYVVQKTDSTGCINYDTALVFVNPKVPVNAGVNRNLCFNDPPLSIVGTGSNILIDSFQWRQLPITDPAIILSHSATLLAGPTINTSYQLVGFSNYAGITCKNYDTMDVLIKALPIINRPFQPPVCQNKTFVALPAVSCLNKPNLIIYTWTYPLNPSAISGSQVVVASLLNQPGTPPANPAGNILRVLVEDTDGCTIKDSTVVSVFPVPAINAGPGRKFCDFASAFNIFPGTQLYSPNGGSLAANEQWFGNGIFKPNAGQNYYAFNPQAPGVKLDTNIITYKFTSTYPASSPVDFVPPISGYTALSPTGGCIVSDTVIFGVIKTPKLEAGLGSAVCHLSDSFNIDQHMIGRSTTAVNALSSYWYFGAPDQQYNSAIFRGRVLLPKHPVIEDSSKQYVLIYADTASSCRVADTTTFSINANPVVSMNYVTPGDSVANITKGSISFALIPAGATKVDGATEITSMPPLPYYLFNVTTGTFSLLGVAEGLYSLTYHYTDPITHCDNRSSINFRMEGNTSLTTIDKNMPGALQIFPNPNNGNFMITANIVKEGNYKLEIFDELGKLVYAGNTDLKTGKNDLEMRIPQATGIYFLRISDQHSQLVRRFVID